MYYKVVDCPYAGGGERQDSDEVAYDMYDAIPLRSA